jgi:dynein heavy chain, axonemal
MLMISEFVSSMRETRRSKFINNRYMTVSSRGITHYIKGVNEFIKIDDWVKESKLFEKLGKIQFFREYKKWKNFFHWQK